MAASRAHERDFFGKNLEARDELVLLRSEGWSYLRLGAHFEMDHTTIIHNLRRFAPSLVGGGTIKAPAKWSMPVKKALPLPQPRKTYPGDKYAYLIDEPTNPGKKYAEYQEEQRKRDKGKREAWLAKLRKEREERVKRLGPISQKVDDRFGFLN